MTANTKYSRSTWKKNQLRSSLNTPSMGNKACSLCYDRSIPSDLSAHVSDSQTCADVHLQLALLRYDNAMCATGQAQYQEICCPDRVPGRLKPTIMFIAGVFLIGYIFKKVMTGRTYRKPDRQSSSSSKSGKSGSSGLPMTHQSSGGSGSGSTLSGSSKRSKGSSELEMPISTAYQNMDIMTMNTMNTRSTSRSRGNMTMNTRSTSRSHGFRSKSSSRPQSRTRSRGRPESRAGERPQSRKRERPKSRARERPPSRPRPVPIEALSRSRSMGRSTSRSRPKSRSRDMARVRSEGHPRDIMSRAHSSSRARSRSRSKSRDRDRRRVQQQQYPQHPPRRGYYDPPSRHVLDYNPNPHHNRHEEASSKDPTLPTQLV